MILKTAIETYCEWRDTESARENHEICPHRSGATVAVVYGILPPATLAEPFAYALPCAAEYFRDFLTHLQHLNPSRYGSIAVFRMMLKMS